MSFAAARMRWPTMRFPASISAALASAIRRMSSWLYLAVAIVLSIGFFGYALALWRNYSDALSRKTFRFSLIHLSVLFAALLVDHYVL